MTTRLVAAYGGSTESAAALTALSGRLGAEPATVTLDLGQGIDLEQVRDHARAAGAARAHIVDGRRELAGAVIRAGLLAGAFDAGPLALAVTRPVIARHLVAVARMEGAADVAHGARGRDRARLDRLIADLAPDLTVHHLAKDGDAAPHVDQNLWGRTVALASPSGAGEAPAPVAYRRTTDPQACAAQPAMVEIAVDRGVPVAVNGVPLDIDELIEVVDTIAGDHGIGRFDVATATSRVLVEAPAAVVLSTAIGELAAAAFDPDLLALRAQMARAYADVVDEGRWHSPSRTALDAFAAATADVLSGSARIQLLRGACHVVGRRLGAPVDDAVTV
jgi:argininosuccinate synthase